MHTYVSITLTFLCENIALEKCVNGELKVPTKVSGLFFSLGFFVKNSFFVLEFSDNFKIFYLFGFLNCTSDQVVKKHLKQL